MNPNSETMANTEAVPQAYNLSFGALCRGAMGSKAMLTTGVHRFIIRKNNPLRLPFGKPTEMGGAEANRATINFSADSDELVEWARDLDQQIENAGKLAKVASGKYCPILKPSKKEEHRPTIAAKCQLVGINAVKCWDAHSGERIELDSFDWKRCRVTPILELRGAWQQPSQWGPSIETRHLQVWTQDESCQFSE